MRDKKFSYKLQQMLKASFDDSAVKGKLELQLARNKINEYTFENLMFGNINVGEVIPFDTYIKELGIDCNTYKLRRFIERKFIDKNERVKDIDMKAAQREFFLINRIPPTVPVVYDLAPRLNT